MTQNTDWDEFNHLFSMPFRYVKPSIRGHAIRLRRLKKTAHLCLGSMTMAEVVALLALYSLQKRNSLQSDICASSEKKFVVHWA